MDTIFALATPEGKSGVAIVRISGQNAFECFKNFSCKIVKVGRSGVRKLFYNEQLLDKAFVLSFKKEVALLVKIQWSCIYMVV